MQERAIGLTMRVADWAAGTGYADLPAGVRAHVKRLLVDYLAAAIVGSRTTTAAIVRDYYGRHTPKPVATVIASAVKLDPAGAAAANGTAAHALDSDDGYTPGGFHPGASIISATLAAAEDLASSAQEMTRAIALGYEVACRIGGASHPAQLRRGFHNTALAGVFGAATAVGALHGFDANSFANAFGLAASHAGGVQAYLDQGAEVKRYHAGKAARDGLVSAELAGAGLTGPTTVLESPHGYFHAFTGDQFDTEHLIGGLGTAWRVLRTYTKPYPCCRHVHGAVDAALALRERHRLQADRIQTVAVETFAIACRHDSTEIHTFLDAQMSLPYTVAAALVHGEVGIQQFDEEARRDPAVLRLMQHVEVREDPQFTAAYPASRPARVSIVSAGTEVTTVVQQPFGEPDNPMSDAEIDAKFRRLSEPVVGPDPTSEIASAAWDLDDSPRLFRALAAGRSAP